MWELPRWTRPVALSGEETATLRRPKIAAHKENRRHAPWRTFRHSITVTNYTVHVVRTAAAGAKGKWIAIETIPTLPLTGLTRKILKAAGII